VGACEDVGGREGKAEGIDETVDVPAHGVCLAPPPLEDEAADDRAGKLVTTPGLPLFAPGTVDELATCSTLSHRFRPDVDACEGAVWRLTFITRPDDMPA
jgi:hypothetical protein